MLELPGYKYITHKIIPRSTGTECRFTVDKEGRHFNEVILVPDEKITDEDLTKLMLSCLAQVDHSVDEIASQRTYQESEVKALLVEKGYLTKDDELSSLKTAAALILAGSK